MRLRANLRLPKEHGAWAMLYVPLVMGILVAGRFSWWVLLLLLSATFFFIARESVLAWWRARRRGLDRAQPRRLMLVYLGLAGLFGAPLMVPGRFYWLAPMAALAVALVTINAELSVRRKDRTIGGEMMAIIGLTLSGLAAHYVASGELELTAFWIWGLSVLYFASSVFYVRLRVQSSQAHKHEGQPSVRWQCAAYHSFMLAVLVLISLRHSLSPLVLLAFAPVLARTAWYLAVPNRSLNLRRIGVLEIVYSLFYTALLTLSFRV